VQVASTQESLLHNPSSGVERRHISIVTEEYLKLVSEMYPQGLMIEVMASSSCKAGRYHERRSSVEETSLGIFRGSSSYGQCGIGVDMQHLRRLNFPILFRVLHDTQGVDPQVPDAKLLSYRDSIEESFWQSRDL
jgi:hypothetical protein